MVCSKTNLPWTIYGAHLLFDLPERVAHLLVHVRVLKDRQRPAPPSSALVNRPWPYIAEKLRIKKKSRKNETSKKVIITCWTPFVLTSNGDVPTVACPTLSRYPCIQLETQRHRLNMEVNLLSLFGLHVTWCAQLYSLAESPETLQLPPSPRIWSRITRALLVSKDRRHLFVSPYPKVRKRTFLLLSFLNPLCFVQTLKFSVAVADPGSGAFLIIESGILDG